MNRLFQVSMLLLVISTNAVAEEQGVISIQVEGLDNNEANLMIALHNTKKTFLKKKEPFRKAIVPVTKDTVVHQFENIPFGEYSVAVFQGR